MKRRETPKDKEVVFPLEKETTIPALMSKGYKRNEIESLFLELQKKEYGVYIKGLRGKAKGGGGNCGKFICNNNCPTSYTMIFKVFRFRKSLEERTPHLDTILSDDVDIDNSCIKPFDVFPPNDSGGYILLHNDKDNKLILARSKDFGFDSIDDCVVYLWDRLHNIINPKHILFKSKIYSKVSQVSSILKGLGWIEIS